MGFVHSWCSVYKCGSSFLPNYLGAASNYFRTPNIKCICFLTKKWQKRFRKTLCLSVIMHLGFAEVRLADLLGGVCVWFSSISLNWPSVPDEEPEIFSRIGSQKKRLEVKDLIQFHHRGIFKGDIRCPFSTRWYDSLGSSWNVCNVNWLKFLNGCVKKIHFYLFTASHFGACLGLSRWSIYRLIARYMDMSAIIFGAAIYCDRSFFYN